MSKFALALVLAVCACGADNSSQQQVDAAGSGSGAMCTGAIFDNCVNNSDCMSGNCHYYMQSNFTVCTQACSATNPCPVDASGQPAMCNMMGICKPAVANTCHL